MQIQTAALSDIGKLRSRNEDRFLCDNALKLFGIADGIGGLPGGAEAAACAVEQVLHSLRVDATPATVTPDLQAITNAANLAVINLGRQINHVSGIGTTLTFGLIRNSQLHLVHIGDSRAYLMRQGHLIRLTADHSVENEFLAHAASGQQPNYDPVMRNALTRCIGQTVTIHPDITHHELKAGDRILFCTDGVTRPITEFELSLYLIERTSPATIIRDMTVLANERGGVDNATAVLVQIDEV